MTRWFAVPVGASTEAGETMTDGNPFPLSGYGLLAASGTPEAFATASGLDSGTIFAARVWVPAGVEITSLWVAVRTGGSYTSGTGNQIGLYDDEGILLGTTADDSSLWSAAGWRGGALAGGPIGAASEGRHVYMLILATGYTGISLPYAPAGSHDAWFAVGPEGGNRRAMFASASSLPASFNPATYGTATAYLPFVAIS